jgi:hypothetical protein
MRRPLAGLVTLLAIPAAAVAQPGLAPTAEPVPAVPAYAAYPPPPPEPVATEPVLVGIEKRQAEDPAADRAFLARSALIGPSGSVTFQARAPLAPGMLGQVTASFGKFELGAGAILVAEEGAVLGLNAKVQLLRSRRAALAASVDVFSPPDEESLYMPSLVASLCADGDECATLLSLHLTALVLESEEEAPVFAGASFSVGRRAKLVGEIHLTDSDSESVVGGYLGGRWGSRKLAFDAGVGFGGELGGSSCYDCYDDTGPDVYPWPFVGLSARM